MRTARPSSFFVTIEEPLRRVAPQLRSVAWLVAYRKLEIHLDGNGVNRDFVDILTGCHTHVVDALHVTGQAAVPFAVAPEAPSPQDASCVLEVANANAAVARLHVLPNPPSIGCEAS